MINEIKNEINAWVWSVEHPQALSGFPLTSGHWNQGIFKDCQGQQHFSRIYFKKQSRLRSPQEEWSSHKIMERPYKISKKLASYQIQGLFKDFIEF